MMEKELKLLFDVGSLTKSTAIYSDIQGGYVLAFHVSGKKSPEFLEIQRGGQRVVKTIDGAAEVIKRIGFRSFVVEL
jgi:soluble cytochrome b562